LNPNQELEKTTAAGFGSTPSRRAKLLGKLAGRFAVPVLTSKRIWFAFTVAAVTDAVQLGLGPLGWAFIDESLDVIAMVLTAGALGFHMLLLPTFVIEFIPVADMLPTWTGCVGVVVMLRKRAQSSPPPLPLAEPNIRALPPVPDTASGKPCEQPVNNQK
jgi:hypothetical protein